MNCKKKPLDIFRYVFWFNSGNWNCVTLEMRHGSLFFGEYKMGEKNSTPPEQLQNLMGKS